MRVLSETEDVRVFFHRLHLRIQVGEGDVIRTDQRVKVEFPALNGVADQPGGLPRVLSAAELPADPAVTAQGTR